MPILCVILYHSARETGYTSQSVIQFRLLCLFTTIAVQWADTEYDALNNTPISRLALGCFVLEVLFANQVHFDSLIKDCEDFSMTDRNSTHDFTQNRALRQLSDCRERLSKGFPQTLAFASCFLGLATLTHAQTASYRGIDTSTAGTWIGQYGSQGYMVNGGAAALPSYIGNITDTGASPYTFASWTAADVSNLQSTAYNDALNENGTSASSNTAVYAAANYKQALEGLYTDNSGANNRIAAMRYTTASTVGSTMTIDFPFNDNNTHQVSLYFLDYDSQSRAETVQVRSTSGAVLASHDISYFVNGQYLIWNVSGHVQFVITQTGGRNAAVSGIFFDAPASPTPQQTLGEIDVTQYGASPGGGDNTTAFQNALNAAGRTGAIVKVPAGNYTFGSPSNPNPSLNIPKQVVLEGVNSGERNYLGYSNGTGSGDVLADHGTVFSIAYGANGTTPFLTLNANSTLRDVALYYPNQPLSSSANWTQPTPYPASIYLQNNDSTVDNVCGVNPYVFITKGEDSDSVRTNVRHVSGQPLYRGLIMESDADVTHFEDDHFGPGWDTGPAMINWMLANSWGFATYRGDDLKFTDCSADEYSRGFYFGFSHIPTTIDIGNSESGPFSGGVHGCHAENCEYGLWIDASRSDAATNFHGCAFSSNLSTNGTAVMITDNVDSSGAVSFDGCRFWQAKGPLLVDMSVPGASTSIINCSFDDWGTQSTGLDPASAAIVIGNTNAPANKTGKVIIADNTFNVDQYTYTYTQGASGVLFDGNTTVNGVHVYTLNSAKPSPSGLYYAIQPSYNANLALDDSNFGTANGSNFQLYGANGSTAQLWSLILNPNNTFGISPACAPGSGIDDYGGSSTSGILADLWQIVPGDTHTQWNLIPQGIPASTGILAVQNGPYNIQPAGSTNLMLDAEGASNAFGTPIDLYTQNNTNAQLWMLTYEVGYIQTGNN